MFWKTLIAMLKRCRLRLRHREGERFRPLVKVLSCCRRRSCVTVVPRFIIPVLTWCRVVGVCHDVVVVRWVVVRFVLRFHRVPRFDWRRRLAQSAPPFPPPLSRVTTPTSTETKSRPNTFRKPREFPEKIYDKNNFLIIRDSSQGS